VACSKKNFKEPLWRSNNVWVRAPKQVGLQFTSEHRQRWSRCDVFGQTVTDPRASRSKWAVSNSDQSWWTNGKHSRSLILSKLFRTIFTCELLPYNLSSEVSLHFIVS